MATDDLKSWDQVSVLDLILEGVARGLEDRGYDLDDFDQGDLEAFARAVAGSLADHLSSASTHVNPVMIQAVSDSELVWAQLINVNPQPGAN
jgi:hypothetical protein